MRGRKRRCQQADDVGDCALPAGKESKNDTEELVRTVKFSLSSAMVTSPGTTGLLQPLLIFCNQVRVLACLVSKHHIFSLLQRSEELPFVPDHNYFARCMSDSA